MLPIPINYSAPVMETALEVGGIGIWNYAPATRTIDLSHTIAGSKTLPPGRYAGDISGLARFVVEEDLPAFDRILEQCENGYTEVEGEFRVRSAGRTVNNGLVWLMLRTRRTSAPDGSVRYVGVFSDTTTTSERQVRRLAHHDALYTMARHPQVVGGANLVDAAAYIFQISAQTLGVQRCGLWQFSSDYMALECLSHVDQRNEYESSLGVVLHRKEFPAYFAAISQRRNLAISDTLNDPTMQDSGADYLLKSGVRALLDVPVFRHGELWGIACFEDSVTTRAWDSDECEFASSAVDLLALSHEISERKKSENELRHTQERHGAFVQASLDSIWSVDIDPPIAMWLPPSEQISALRERGLISDANDAFCRDYKLDVNSIIGQKLSQFMPELFKGTSLSDWIDRNYKLHEREMRRRMPDDEHHWISLTLLGIVESGQLVRLWGARRNITDRMRYQTLLRQLAYRDPLTGLLNRQCLVSEVNAYIDPPSPAPATKPAGILLLLDLDQFKDINDTLGHNAGDEVLRQIRARFDEALSDEDAIAGRLGGDEFAVFVRGTSATEEANRIGAALTEAINAPFVISGGKFHISASIGAATFPADGRTFSALAHAADEAMYHAKETGGGVRLYARSTLVFEPRKLMLLAGLPDAIERGELVLEYQPIVDCATNKPVRMEALVRWNHQEYGRLGANDFIYKAEMSDAIRVLTRWVINTAISAARDWQSIAPGVGVAINISPRLLGDSNVIDHLQQCVATHGFPANLVDIEITETSLIHNQEHAAQILETCRKQGYSVMIDDYGVGFCSLTYLRRLPLKGLKLDQSFVSRVMEDAEDAIIVQSTIALAHNLGMTVVAEGVENEAILAFLKANGCDFAQGFGIARPVEIAHTKAWLRRSALSATAIDAGLMVTDDTLLL
ncbi:MAG: EAL domain-containing protein [Casimicrobium sp.]